jgi:ribosomal protein S6
MGLKNLAYPVAKQKKGFYICLNYAAKPTCTAEMDRQLRYDEQVLRFMSLTLSEKVNVEQRRKEIEKQLQAMASGSDVLSEVSVGIEEVTVVPSEETVSEDVGGK